MREVELRKAARVNWKEHPDQNFLICMGFDSMRIAMGLKPKNYSIHEVVTWIQCIAEKLRKANH
jgi:hypothetical protein